jgi:replication initiation protein RepC
MGNLETPVPRGMAAGLRKLTTHHLLAARMAEQVRGLPPGIKHPNQLLAAMRRAAPYLGHGRLLPLMEALFRWTQPQDWSPDGEPIVWPSNDDLATALGCSERHVSRLIATAIEARLLVPRDGSDRKRRGFRENGCIVWAWGLNLRPMAARHADFRAAAEAGEQARRQCQALRRQASIARQSVAQLLELARHHDLPATEFTERYQDALRLCASLRRMDDPGRIAPHLAALHALVSEATAWVEQAVENGDMSGLADSGVRPILLTRTPTEPEGSTVTAQPLAAPALPPLDTALNLSPEELLRLAPKLKSYLTTSRPGWGDVSDAAAALARHLDIPSGLYGEACQRLGRKPAAIAIAIISAKQPGYFHSAGPGGYLRGMLRRASQGALFLERSIFGLRDASGYAPRAGFVS